MASRWLRQRSGAIPANVDPTPKLAPHNGKVTCLEQDFHARLCPYSQKLEVIQLGLNPLSQIETDIRFKRTRSLAMSLMEKVPQDGLVQEALKFMYMVHFGQHDRPDGQPYVSHPLDVALQVALRFGVQDSKLVIAALLHDAVEDRASQVIELSDVNGATPQTDALAVICDRFGSDVGKLVAQLTNPDFKLQAAKSPGKNDLAGTIRQLYHDHVLALFDGDLDAALIKYCDFSQNALKLASLGEGPKKIRLQLKYGPVIRSLIEKLRGLPQQDHPLYHHRLQLVQELETCYQNDYA